MIFKRLRKETELQFFIHALKLQKEITIYVMKEKFLPKKWRYMLGQDLINKVNELVDNLAAANNIYPKTENDLNTRRHYQNRALTNYDQIAYKLNNMVECVQTVTIDSLKNIIEVESMGYITLKRWRDKDTIKADIKTK